MRIVLLLLFAFTGSILSTPASGQSYNLLIGSYTRSVNDDGIYVYDFNSQTGDFKLKSKTSGELNPSFLDVSRDGKYVFAVNETREGKVSSFLFNPVSGELKFVNRVGTGGGPCYVTVDDRNKYVFAGNYGGGSLIAIPLNSDGSLGDNSQFIQQETIGAFNGRERTNLHSTVLSPDNKYLLAANLGTDRVSVYKFNSAASSEPLTPAESAFASVERGSGPRHIAFHPGSRYVYVIQEMAGDIVAFDFKKGRLTGKQTVTMLPPGVKGKAGAADIHVSPDGKFLYGTVRGDANTIVTYSIDRNGMLTHVDTQPTLGVHPRNFAIDPTGNFLLVAHQNTNDVIIFKRDKTTGKLTPTGKKIELDRPVCLKFTK